MIVISILFLLFIFYTPTAAMAAKADKSKMSKEDPIESWQANPRAAFDANMMSDMSDFDPTKPVIPTGDTIRIGAYHAIFRSRYDQR